MLTKYQREKMAELLFTGECFIEKDSFQGMKDYLELGDIIEFEYTLEGEQYYCKRK